MTDRVVRQSSLPRGAARAGRIVLAAGTTSPLQQRFNSIEREHGQVPVEATSTNT